MDTSTQFKYNMQKKNPGETETIILTMNFLWPKGENKLHFSIFWKPVVCTQRGT